MKKHHFQSSLRGTKQSTFHFQLIIWLLFLGSCNYSGKQKDMQPVESAVGIDSPVTPTGNAELDSLLQLAAVMPCDTNLVKLYYQIGDLYEDNDHEKGKEYYLKLKNLSEQLDWNEGRLLFASTFSIMLCREGLPDSALVLLSPALELAKRENNEKWVATITFNTGQVYFGKAWYETALSYYMEAMPIFEKINSTETLGNLYRSIAAIYNRINLPEKAIEYSEKVLFLIDKQSSLAVYVLNDLGLAYSTLQQYEKSNDYYEQALELCIRQNNLYMLEGIYMLLGNNAIMVFDLDKAEMYAKKMLETSGSVDNMSLYHGYLLLLGKLEQLKGNFAKSEKYILEALGIANEYESLETKKVCYLILQELSVAQHKYQDNIRYLKEIEKIEMALALETTARSSEEMAVKYETEKKELEIERKQHIIDQQILLRGLLAGGVAVCFIFLILLWYMLQLRNRRNRALAEMNATKDKFFSIISHDLKNPAISQRDALQMLVKNAHLWDIDTLTGYYHELLKSAEGQVELLYNLLNWAQIQTGRMAYTPVTFNLPVRLRSEISLIRKQAENKGITLTVRMPDDALVTGDGNMLATAVRNLLTNAVKFTPTNGEVSLSVEPTGDGKCIVTVADTGIGMSKEQVNNLLYTNNVETLHATSLRPRRGTADEQGSGLGLIVCKELLEKHGSTLHIESEEGKGSRFWFEI